VKITFRFAHRDRRPVARDVDQLDEGSSVCVG
jgi:hypothetical protein